MEVFMVKATDFMGFTLNKKIKLLVHHKEECAGFICPIHNVSDHHMVDWPQLWRGDRKMMERICPHGVGHPDPDDKGFREDRTTGLHGCDGCCA